ncbi:sterol desaturase family protein [Vacuolonema iberomarrocanum]|uniref:sterol desaturase family protein n=1 Tax=Vacuolonema iberomarrocanum TaxID=3454632 RepID=UPI001A105CA2|nr:sterol desaturase family protein [filamentous cyanobacterium LEGE 07170]
MTLPTLAILITFWLLVGLSVRASKGWQQLSQKPRADWVLDLCGLVMQGVVIPALQVGLLYQGLHAIVPWAAHRFALPSGVGFFICLVVVDYGYYWNHRWLHGQGWLLHRVHHTVTQLDVLGTSRNTLWASFFILYLWVHTLMLYLLEEPSGYGWGISLTAMLDLWRHSPLGPQPRGWLYRCLSPWLVLPQDHAQHHACQEAGCNFGANFKIWDHLHGTTQSCPEFPKAIGIRTPLNLWQKLFYPIQTP